MRFVAIAGSRPVIVPWAGSLVLAESWRARNVARIIGNVPDDWVFGFQAARGSSSGKQKNRALKPQGEQSVIPVVPMPGQTGLVGLDFIATDPLLKSLGEKR